MLADVKILAVDDDNFNLQIIQAMLEDMAATIYTANNGQEALDLLESIPGIDIVLLDLQMPVMDGFEALQRIKHNSRFFDRQALLVHRGGRYDRSN